MCPLVGRATYILLSLNAGLTLLHILSVTGTGHRLDVIIATANFRKDQVVCLIDRARLSLRSSLYLACIFHQPWHIQQDLVASIGLTCDEFGTRRRVREEV